MPHPKERLGNLIKQGRISIFTGPFGSSLHSSDYVDIGVPVVPTEAIGRRSLVSGSLPAISSAVAKRLSRYVLNFGDIVFARRGLQATGLSAVISKEQAGWVAGTGVIVLRVHDPEIDTSYLSFALSSDASIAWLKSHAVGAVMPNLNSEIIAGLQVPLPSFSVQRAMASILSVFDDKIELNRRMNQTLEAMARAIFKSWFVDFEPVLALELPPALKVPSRLDLVSEGWVAKPLDSIADFLNGLALQKFPPGDEGSMPVIKIADLRRGNTESSERAGLDVPDDYVVENGAVLFSWSGTLEVVVWTGGRGALNQHIFKVSSKEYPKWLYLYWLKEHLPSFRAIAADKATTMGHIQRRHLTEALVVVPPPEVLQVMDQKMAPLLEKQIQNSLESNTLTALRDTLLPKLLSGEIRIKQAEKIVEDVL